MELIWAYWCILIIKIKIFSLGEGLSQRLDDTALTTKDIYSINFTIPRKRFVLGLHYNGSNSFLSVTATEIHHFRAKDYAIKDYALCLSNISKVFTINNKKKKGLKEILNFPVDFNPIDKS